LTLRELHERAGRRTGKSYTRLPLVETTGWRCCEELLLTGTCIVLETTCVGAVGRYGVCFGVGVVDGESRCEGSNQERGRSAQSSRRGWIRSWKSLPRCERAVAERIAGDAVCGRRLNTPLFVADVAALQGYSSQKKSAVGRKSSNGQWNRWDTKELGRWRDNGIDESRDQNRGPMLWL